MHVRRSLRADGEPVVWWRGGVLSRPALDPASEGLPPGQLLMTLASGPLRL